MFEHHCQAGGASRAHKVNYSLRVRFCGPCYKTNVKLGYKMWNSFLNLPPNIFKLVPLDHCSPSPTIIQLSKI
ncbi:hypothetical protein PILCRDRAFT_814519 [Piloderma croceum F 1598]|uniref:Uncharacterized protein n=1 Tax=Piloderma croceum (strain F 1598) TaxID=765440 RepID=A0A0C3G7R1_PILCF|nr:hypothetical protein PILCRDRAFT_814519 [Piloderma croceum F 1598]